MKPKVSIIVPIFKVERYIEDCVLSLFKQTLSEIEYIFIDDCSPDNSIWILENVLSKFPDRKNDVKIIRHTSNLGVSISRQEGVDNATGQYIIHCDPDDWVESEMYELMFNIAIESHADIVMCDFMVEDSSGQWIRRNSHVSSGLDCAKQILLDNIHGGTCNKLIKAELYKDKGIKFPQNINIWEDFCTIIPLVMSANKIIAINDAFYHYRRINSESYTLQVSEKKVIDTVNAIKYVENFIICNSIDAKRELDERKLETKLNLLNESSGVIQENVAKLFPELKFKSFRSNIRVHWKFALYLNDIFGVCAFRIAKKLISILKRQND